MKKLFLLGMALVMAAMLYAQTPAAFKYQAVARDASGAVLANRSVSFQISIIEGGSVVFQEIHSTATNEFGLINLEIGNGSGVMGNIAAIDWASGPHYLKVEMDPNGGASFSYMGTSQLLSVPYALHAKTVENDQVNDADADPANEIQTIELNGTLLTLSKGGGTVTLPTTGGGDNWGTQVVLTDATLTGNGTSTSPLKLAQMGASNGQTLKWNGSTWAAAADETGSGGSNPTGPAGGDLTGTYPNPMIGDARISSNHIVNGTITTEDLANLSVSTDKIITGAVTGAKIAQLGATTGQTLSWNGSTWAPASAGGGGDNWGTQTVAVDAGYFSGNGTTIAPLKLATMGASAGLVLKYNGTKWNPAIDDAGPFTEFTDEIAYVGSKYVGIGVSSPSRKLTVAQAGSESSMNILSSSTGLTASDGLLLGMTGLDGLLTTYENGSLFLGTNGNIRMTIDSNGDAGIGVMFPAYKLDVAGPANLNKGLSGAALRCDGDEAIWYNGTYFSWGYGGTYNYFKDAVGIDCIPGDGHMLAVNGVASKPGGGSWAAFSDIRLKDVHGNYERGLADIINLQPVQFNYKEGNELKLPSDQEYVGFVAQEVEKIFPEAITKTESGYLEFDMHPVNVALVNAVKELKAENDLLQQKNSQMKAEIDQIKTDFERRLSKLENK